MDTLRFYFVTWNVATKSPDQDLNSLLDFPSQYNKSKALPDFYVIGLQEVKSQPQNLLMDSLFTDPWTSTFNKILCRQGFISAKSIRLQGILLLVYSQMKHVTHLRDIEAQYTKTGLGGMWGNKGAVSVRFTLYGCSVCLVNCHLTAHDHLLADRINDYNTILAHQSFHVADTANILYHDYVFWIGDLNFRTAHPVGGAEAPSADQLATALQRVEKDKYATLLKHDQLMAVMEAGEAFSEFSEPEIRFPPTYKFLFANDEYDLKRRPSWTDRILYKVIPNNYENLTLRADLVSYSHMPQYTVSDHKPVVATYHIKIRKGQPKVAAVPQPPKAARAQVRMRSALVLPPDALDASGAGGIAVPTSALLDIATADTSTAESSEPDTTFSNYTEKTVEFAPLSGVWYVGDADFRAQCTLSPDVQVNPNDWIGIYDADFHSLDDYIAYEYLAKVSLPEAAPEVGRPRTIILSFPVGSGVRTPGFYRFIYFSQPNNDVRSVLGISEPFEVSSKEEKLAALDPCIAGATAGRVTPQATATTSDIFSDFTGLDVTSLSRHFSNDLGFD